ncbi:hypothetical protein PIB30_052247 [Stylosanthes scabra]|uniref:CCHC-type domain-containing protein n=1 Tax=Stylosanthes scabra TaxID=79078 RepID=A0ABU6UGW5_9FABA|nr:hypothetical protein [Stylosanthes scabra]
MFDTAVNGLVRLCEQVEGRRNIGSVFEDGDQAGAKINDPTIVKTKGGPRIPKKGKGRKRRCTKCNRPGHTKRKCQRAENKQDNSDYVPQENEDSEQSRCSDSLSAYQGVGVGTNHRVFGACKSGSVTSPDSEKSDDFLH